MSPPRASGTELLGACTPDSRRWRHVAAAACAVAAPVLLYATARLVGSAWSGTLPSLLVLLGGAATLLAAAGVPTALLSPDGGRAGRPRGGAGAETDAVAELKRRYAAGEVSEEEFEQRLETLVATEERPAARAAAVSEPGGDSGGPASRAATERN